ncbi:hypothetical protein ACPPVU_22980 [Mucilaginibacter sp. McL0603]|uniref:hypothetical protein n=1 Tax=Mucilaginibacter sp. McL0603 TaxID=3415670 RepID=UPI003CFACB1F
MGFNILKGIRHYWWYLYFSAYWSAYNWGEKNTPQSNAINLLYLITLLVLSGLLQIALLFGIKLSGMAFIAFCGLPALIIPYWSISKNKMYKERLREYDYLKAKEFNYKRNVYVISVLVFAIALNTSIAIIRNLASK